MSPTPNNSDFFRIQKLAGLITEEEYNARMWYNNYSKNLSNNIKNLKQLLLNK